MRLDQLDHDILLALRENARMKAAEIARRTGSNERTVRNRIERLTGSGLVRLTTVIDPHACGFGMAADVFVAVQGDHEDEVLRRLGELPEVNYIAYSLDAREVSIQARFKDSNGFRLFLRRLEGTPHLAVTRYALVPLIVKDAASWIPALADLVEVGAEPAAAPSG